MPSTATTQAEAFIYGLLTGDSALTALVGGRVYGYIAPPEAALPAVVFQQQAGVDLVIPGPARVWSDLTYLVRTIGRGPSWGPLEAVDARVDALLTGAQSGPGPGLVYACYRLQPYTLVEVDSGVQYRHLGGIYRLLVQPT